MTATLKPLVVEVYVTKDSVAARTGIENAKAMLGGALVADYAEVQ